MDEFDYDEKPGLEGEEQEETDYDDGPEPYVKEEPDCHSCNDSGCPDCGHIDPDDPEHQKYMAAQIIEICAVAAGLPFAAGVTPEAIRAMLPEVTDEQVAAVQALAESATVTISATWPEPNASPYSNVQPF